MNAERKITMVVKTSVTLADAEAVAAVNVVLDMFVHRDGRSRRDWYAPRLLSRARTRRVVRLAVAANGPSAGAVAARSRAELETRIPSVAGRRPTADVSELVKPQVRAAFAWETDHNGAVTAPVHIRHVVSRTDAVTIITARVLQRMVTAKNDGRNDWYRFPWTRAMSKRAVRYYVKQFYREHGDQAPARARAQVNACREALAAHPETPPHVAQMAAWRVGRTWDWAAPAAPTPDDDAPAVS